MPTSLYSANHRKYEQSGHITPGVFKQDGKNPTLPCTVAPYLPTQRYNKHDEDWIVLSQGKLVAQDSYGYVVPAGYALDRANEVADGSGVITYTQDDVDEGILNAEGNTVTLAEKVVTSLIAAGITVGRPFAVAALSYYRSSSDELRAISAKRVALGGSLPIEWRYNNYNPQGKISFEMDYVLELPVISTYVGMPFKGSAVFYSNEGRSLPIVTSYVKSNVYSDFVLLDTGTDSWFEKVGQIISIDQRFPKGFLKYVQTVFGTDTGGGAGSDFSTLDEMPGSASDGLPDKITYAGGSATLGTVQINLTDF